MLYYVMYSDPSMFHPPVYISENLDRTIGIYFELIKQELTHFNEMSKLLDVKNRTYYVAYSIYEQNLDKLTLYTPNRILYPYKYTDGRFHFCLDRNMPKGMSGNDGISDKNLALIYKNDWSKECRGILEVWDEHLPC